jgi:hypothetical protein
MMDNLMMLADLANIIKVLADLADIINCKVNG